MTEDRVESFLHVQRSIAETLEIYGKLYNRQCEQLQKLQGDVDTCAQPDLQAVRDPVPTQACQLMQETSPAQIIDSSKGTLNSSCICTMTTYDKAAVGKGVDNINFSLLPTVYI